MAWSKLFLLGWLVILGSLIAYEIYAAVHGGSDPTLTDVVSRYLPWWVTMIFLSWLWLHFAAQYTYPSWLRKIIGG